MRHGGSASGISSKKGASTQGPRGGGILRNASHSKSPARSDDGSASRYSKTPGSASQLSGQRHEPSTLKKKKQQSSGRRVRMREGAQRPIEEAQGEEESYDDEGEMSYGGEEDSDGGSRAQIGMDMRQVPNDSAERAGYGEEDDGESEDESLSQSQLQGNEGLEQRLEQIKENIKKQRAETDLLSDQLSNSIAAKEFAVRNQKTLEELEEELQDQRDRFHDL